MERHDYVFTKEFTMKFMRGLIRGLRRSPFSGLISDWIPDDMPKRALGAVVNLFLASGPIHRELKKADEAELRRSGYRLSDSALRTFLEKLRERDHETFKEVKRWREFDRYNENSQQQPTAVFHDYFRPRNEL